MYIAGVELSGRITRRTINDYVPILNFIKNKKRAAGLLLVINSEGGDANSSEILYNKVKEIREKKPVYSVIQGMGASGAYWVASASNKIYSMETSLVGSIGVISIFPNVAKLMEKIGVSVEVNKIGEYKDMTSPFKEMEPAAKDKFKRIMEVTFSRFREDVKKNRNIKDSSDDEVFNGQIFAARDALDIGLLDQMGDFSEASTELAKKLSIKRKVKMFWPRRSYLTRLITPEFVSGVISDIIKRDL